MLHTLRNLVMLHLLGWADNFIGERLGLSDNLEGLSDFYIKAATKVSGVALRGAVHHFRDDSFSEAYGWEANLVAVKKLSDSTTAVAKYSYYFGDDDGPATVTNDINQFSVQLDYKF